MDVKIKLCPTQSVVLKATTQLMKQLGDVCSYQKLTERQLEYANLQDTGWDGRVSLLNKMTGTFPSGLAPRIFKWLKEQGHNVEIEKHLVQTHPHKKLLHINPPPILRDYQQEAVRRMVKYKRGQVVIATGGGKTLSSVGLVGELKRTTIFFTHTNDLVDQTRDVYQRFFPDIKIGKLGDGVFDPGLITIASVQTVYGLLIPPKEPKRKLDEFDTEFSLRMEKFKNKLESWTELNERALKFLNQFSVAIFDECHHVAADTFFTCAQACNGSEYLFGLSATPFRDTGDELLIEAGCGDIIFEMGITELVKRGYLLPAEIHIHDYPELPPMDLGSNYAVQYKICITENEERNNKIADIIEQEYLNKKSVLILCREIPHITNLSLILEERNVEHEIIHAKLKDRENILARFKKGETKVMIASSIMGEGVDIPKVDVIVLAKAGKSRVQTYQGIGRALRPYPDKDKAVIHDFKDSMKTFSRHFKVRMQTYKLEESFQIVNHVKPKKRQIINKIAIVKQGLAKFESEIND